MGGFMNYHNILHDDMRNGEGLRVVLFVSGCPHECPGCHNSETWYSGSGIPFDYRAKEELFTELQKDYVSGITFSGGDPLAPENRDTIYFLCKEILQKFPAKDIWLYTGYTWEEIWETYSINWEIVSYCDVIVEGRFNNKLSDVSYHWAGSTNQRVIDVQKSLSTKEVCLWQDT